MATQYAALDRSKALEDLICLMSSHHESETSDDLLLLFMERITRWPGIIDATLLFPGKRGTYDLESCKLLDNEQSSLARGYDWSQVVEPVELPRGLRFSPILHCETRRVILVTKIEPEQGDPIRPWLRLAELALQRLVDFNYVTQENASLQAKYNRALWDAAILMTVRVQLHEMINCVKNIQSWAWLAKRGDTNLDALASSTDRLAAIISELMNTGAGRIRQRLCALGEELARVLQRMNLRHLRKLEGCEVRLRVADNKNRKVLVDPDSLTPILMNLILNAMQAYAAAGRRGAITITVIEKEVGSETYTGFEVLDHAGGIPTEFQARIFDAGWTSKSGAEGLGLWLVRKLVEACGGRILVDSEYGNFAKFTVVYPIVE